MSTSPVPGPSATPSPVSPSAYHEYHTSVFHECHPSANLPSAIRECHSRASQFRPQCQQPKCFSRVLLFWSRRYGGQEEKQVSPMLQDVYSVKTKVVYSYCRLYSNWLVSPLLQTAVPVPLEVKTKIVLFSITGWFILWSDIILQLQSAFYLEYLSNSFVLPENLWPTKNRSTPNAIKPTQIYWVCVMNNDQATYMPNFKKNCSLLRVFQEKQIKTTIFEKKKRLVHLLDWSQQCCCLWGSTSCTEEPHFSPKCFSQEKSKILIFVEVMYLVIDQCEKENLFFILFIINSDILISFIIFKNTVVKALL